MILQTRIGLLLIFSFSTLLSFSQTSWKGTTSTSWSTASNWTAGVPNATTDAIIGDGSFTGAHQPTISSTATCKSLTIGGTVAATVTIKKTTTVLGAITINANGSITQMGTSLTLTGNWINNGTYTASNNNTNVIFAGVTQSLQGSNSTTFRRLTINAGSVTTLNTNTTVSGSGSSCTVKGTLNPGESPSKKLTSSSLIVNANAVLKVNDALFTDNYTVSGTTFNAGSTVEYASTLIDQTVSSSFIYSTLTISGNTTKTLIANLPSLLSSGTMYGNISVKSGTFDLATYTADRGASTIGGSVSVSNGASIKIGGTNTFPANYNTNTFSLTSTVEYNGASQTVSSKMYGNLKMSSSSGAAVKTLPATALTIIGDFTLMQGNGSSVTATAGANITVSGFINIGTSASLSASSYTISVGGNWVNNGSFAGGSGTVNLTGPGTSISGTGTHNFYNLNVMASAVTAASTSYLTIAGNFATSGPGAFSHSNGGTFSMSGTSKTISGTDISLDNLTISGSVTTASSLTLTGNLSVVGSFAGSNDLVVMAGTSKTISGAGTISFSSFQATGSISASTSFSISSSLDVSGSFSASAGTATFTSTSALNGTANLFNVAINGTSLTLSSNAVLGIANLFTITAGTLNVSSNIPNTVSYNGTGAQSITATTYHHLDLSNGNTKSTTNAITVNGNLTIGSLTTFAAGSYTHNVAGNWINNGSFIGSTGTIQLNGSANTSITGATTFNVLTINKTFAVAVVRLLSNVSVPVVNMTSGSINTGSSALTITNTRNGNGIILGTITRTHSFGTGTSYAFEGPYNTITFTAASGVTSVTVNVTTSSVSDFPNGGSINRVYNISVPAGTYTATLRLHYEDVELNGNTEATMQLWQNGGSSWSLVGKLTNSATNNYVEQSLLTNITNRWTCFDNAGVVKWNGSVSSNWNTAANWTTVSGLPSTPPSANDIVQIASSTFTNQPTIITAVTVKGIVFGSAQNATLTIGSGGSLITSGNISGSWSANATHTISVGDQDLTVNGDLVLSDGTTGHAINLAAGNGNMNVNGSLTESGNAAITISGTAILNIKNAFSYIDGTFTAGSGTVTYSGTGNQAAAALNYNNLSINKASGIADIITGSSVAGNLNIVAGELDLDGNCSITGNLSIAPGGGLHGDGVTINVSGNWNNSGNFYPGTGTVTFNGNAAQSVSASTFNNVVINKTAGIASLTGNISVNSNLSVTSGTLNVATYTANRTAAGGLLTISNGATLTTAGANNFPQNFNTNTLGNSSLVHYNGTIAQTVSAVPYGNLSFSNGGSNSKTLNNSISVSGDITINSGATSSASAYTLTLSGNWVNNGTFVPGTGTVVLIGTTKTVTGNTTFNRLTVYGSYAVAGSDIIYNGLLNVTNGASYAAGTGTATVNGDLTNSGILTSAGTTTFSGTATQTIHLINALTSTSIGVVNFNGTVSPILNSTSTPTFYNLNINNSGGINPSVDWQVVGAMTIGSGGVFNGGNSTHRIYGNFTNSGTVTSTGTINFSPSSAAATVQFGGASFASTGTVNFGGSAVLSIIGTPTTLTHVRITNTNAAGITPPSGWTIDDDLVIANTSLFNAGSYAYTVAGDIESNGTLDGGSSTFTMTSAAGLLTGSPSTTFNNFTISGAVTVNSDFNVAGNFTNNGTYDGSVGILIMTGAGAGTIGGTTTPSTIDQLTISKSSNAVVTLGVNVANVSTLFITSGVLATSTYAITQDASGGVILISNGARLRLGGTNSLPGFSAYGLDQYSTVEYAGTSQIVGNAASYGNLSITAAGTKTAVVPLIVQNDFTLSAGTFSSAVTVTHSIGGNWTMTGGTYSNASSTILFNGKGDQYISSTGAFNNVTINKSSGLVYLASAATVNTTLTLTSGKISLESYDLTIGNSGTINNASATNYIIATGTGTLNQQLTASAIKVFPVGLTSSYTPATITQGAGTTTDILSVRMIAAAYADGTSGALIIKNAVNATWMISEAVVGGSSVTVTLQWPVNLELTGFSRAACRLSSYGATTWDYGPADMTATGTNPYTVTRAGFTSLTPFIVSKLDPLPVRWLSMSGSRKNDDNYIYWSTAAEIDNDYFSVETSADGINFNSIGRVNGAVNSGTDQEYSFIHYNAPGSNWYYRIKQTDLDGKYSYSRVIRITVTDMTQHFSLGQNPVQSDAILNVTSISNRSTTVTVYNMAGQSISRKQFQLKKGSNMLAVDMTGFSKGMYIIEMADEGGSRNAIRVVKN